MATTISFRQTIEGILAELEACSDPIAQNEIENIINQNKNMVMIQQVDIANGSEFCSFMDNLAQLVSRAFANGPRSKNEIVGLFKNVMENLPNESI